MDAKAASEVIRVVSWLMSATVGLVVPAVVLLRIDLLLGVAVPVSGLLPCPTDSTR